MWQEGISEQEAKEIATMALCDNGWDYDLLQRATRAIKNVQGMTCEVGLREGGGSKYIIDSLLQNNDHNRVHIAIDPYGRLPYIQSEDHVRTDGPYPDEMMTRTLSELYAYVHGKPIKVLFFALEDTEFFKRYSDGVPVYHEAERWIITQYALVFLDGPHNLASTLAETVWFAARSVPGSIIVYDDIQNYYDHSKIKEYLEGLGWKQFELANSKASYRKE